jgi:hypothetical protein
MDNSDPSTIDRIEAAIKDLDLDYMRGWVSEDEYNQKMEGLRSQLIAAGGAPSARMPSPIIEPTELATATLTHHTEKKATIDPVSAVKRTVQGLRKIPIEKIAQDSGIAAHEVAKILTDLLDGREISGRVDHESGDFILGTGTGPSPKTVHGCPYCRAELDRVAVRGETVTCNICRQSFIVT